MLKTIVACVLVVVMLAFASTASLADTSNGVPPLQCNKGQNTLNNAVPYAKTDCGPYTCENNGTCCGDDTCCPSGYNIYCKNKSLCYTSTADAARDCGNDYTICYSPAN